MTKRGRLTMAVIGVCAAFTALAQELEPVHFSKLLPLLPETVEGWTAEKPDGSTTAAMGFKVTQVSRQYRKGDARVDLKIMDGSGTQVFAAAHATMVQFSNESTDGYEKGFTLDGNPATERYTNESKDGTLTVFVAKRFVVEVDIDGLPNTAMQEWFKKIDLQRLQALKP